MKSLIFCSLVLGSASYLFATQSETVQQWLQSVQHPKQMLPVESQQHLGNMFNTTEQVAKELSHKNEAKAIVQAVEQKTIDQTETTIDKLVATTPLLKSEAQKKSLYMPIEERSNALMALVQRMEMKAAGY